MAVLGALAAGLVASFENLRGKMANIDSNRYEVAWGNLQKARQTLYRTTGQKLAERGAADLKGVPNEGTTAFLTRSEELRSVLQEGVTSDDADVRDLAAMKLLAAAAYDLSIAGDLLTHSDKPATGPERGVSLDPEIQSELDSVLDVPLTKAGVRQLVASERAALPTDFAPARDELDKEVTRFLKDIPENAVALAGSALSGAVSFATPTTGWETALGQEFLEHVPGGLPWAAKLAVEGIQKLWSALGKDQKSQVLDEAKDWVKEAKSKGSQALVAWLYQVPDLDKSVHAMVKAAPPGTDPARINTATRRLDQLLGRYTTTKKILSGIMKVVAFFKVALLAAVPWGPVTAYAVYVLVFGYAIYAGGDYLDSPRFEKTWLDHVEGLAATVAHAVS